MDRKQRDGSSAERREEAVTRRLGHALERLERIAPPEAGECLDPEQIAAYEQRALAPEELVQCENHLAACSRCREILQLVATTDAAFVARDAAAAAEAPLIAAARDAAAKAQPRRSWWRSPWLVPAFAATAAVALVFFVWAPWHSSERATSTLTAEAPAAQPPLPPLPPLPEALTAQPPSGLIAPPADQGSSANALSGRNPGGAAAASSPAPQAPSPPAASQAPRERENYAEAENDARAAKPEAAAVAAPSAGAAKSEARPPAPSNADRSAAPSPAAPPPSSAAQSRAANAAPQTREGAEANAGISDSLSAAEDRAERQNAAGSATKAQAARAPAPLPAAQATPTRAFGALSRKLGPVQLSVFFLSVTSPSSAVSWRAGQGGLIERSSDGGRTWQSQPSPLAEDWLAGSAVSDTVCWLVGRNGAIARTVDGRSWQQIPGPPAALAPADASGKQPDWMTISASDARTAVIGSSSQTRYITRDAGQTWQRQP